MAPAVGALPPWTGQHTQTAPPGKTLPVMARLKTSGPFEVARHSIRMQGVGVFTSLCPYRYVCRGHTRHHLQTTYVHHNKVQEARVLEKKEGKTLVEYQLNHQLRLAGRE